MEDKRICLKEGQEIELSTRADGSVREKFTIRSVIGKGGSAICYEAVRERDGYREQGKLKEFYPISGWEGYEYDSVERKNGQLVPGGGTIHVFQSMCQEYIRSYLMLKETIIENPESQVLKNYIQDGEILYGCLDKEKKGVLSKGKDSLGTPDLMDKYQEATVYIWSSGVEGKSFDKYLEEVREEPERDSDFRLHEILQAVYTLTDCIKVIHTAELLHLDIKPSNFLVPYDSEMEINPNGISVFDINTLNSVDGDSESFMHFVTEGYSAPEMYNKDKTPDCSSDIYSIGAVLFHAIVILDDLKDGLYRNEYYKNIPQMVRNSKLLRNAEASLDVKFVSKLVDILKKCLAYKSENRYESCEKLMEDLEKAVKRLEPYTINPKLLGHNKKLAVVDANEKGVNTPTIVIQKMLYDIPLYKSLNTDKKEINVLTVGSGTYGQKFIDICLQTGQIKDYSLNVKAVSNDAEKDRMRYEEFRPYLSHFVNINDSMEKNRETAYANLDFCWLGTEAGMGDEDTAFGKNDRGENKKIISGLISKAYHSGMNYQYIFIALGDARLNQYIAGIFKETLEEWNQNCPVCYISERTRKIDKKAKARMLYPISIDRQIKPEMIDLRLDQMAFNTHISWSNSLNMDVKAALKKFRSKPYDYSSSMAYALSIKYKLYSIGIDMDSDTVKSYQQAAELFERDVLNGREEEPEKQRDFECLVALEHKRWVLEKVCDGWTAPLDKDGNLDLEECVRSGKVRNELKQTHPCLVFSDESSPLKGDVYSANNYEKWEAVPVDSKLDELDSMSVKLHQCFKKYAEEYINSNPLYENDMQTVWEMISDKDDNIIRAFKQFRFCLKNILNGVRSYTKQYDYYEKNFIETLNVLTTDVKDEIERRLALIKKAFYPVKEANLYRNYKAYDEVLVEKIPFILTYCFQPKLAVAFEDGKTQNGRNEAIFTNVAAATVLSPEEIYYLYYFNSDSDVDWFIKKIETVLNYLSKRNVHCSVKFGVVSTLDVDTNSRNRLQKELERIKKKDANSDLKAKLTDYEIFDCKDYDEASAALFEYLQINKPNLYQGGTDLFYSMWETGVFVNRVSDSGIGYFEFDWRNKKFNCHYDCSYLQFVQDESFIRINDMFALMNAVENKYEVPEFADDYENLWGIYTGCYLDDKKKFENGVGNWNNLCMCLEDYESKREPLVTIPMTGKVESTKKFCYFLPNYTFRTVKHILEKLIVYGVVDKNSTLVSYASDTCRLEIHAKASMQIYLNAIFNKHHLLLDYYHIEVKEKVENRENFVFVTCNDLEVKELNLISGKKEWQEATLTTEQTRRRDEFVKSLYRVLDELQRKHFITGLEKGKSNPCLVNFRYSSPRIKEILTNAGMILEIYTYYEVLKTGYFDDVACGYEFNWEEGGVKNELDLVLTKGFRSIIVECKAVLQLELNYYHKLHSIAEHFGIGTTKVLIGNTYRHNNPQINQDNKMQRSRGTQLHIKTISAEDKIKNIGVELMKLMKDLSKK